VSPEPPGLPKGLPGCLKRRQLLNNPALSPEVCREYGQKFLDLGWRDEALAFFQRGGVAEELEKLKAYCLETGDAFLLGRLGPQAPEDWRHAGERALALGKLHFARRAFEMAGDDEKTALAAGLIAGQATASDS
jgi:hypothetical protein